MGIANLFRNNKKTGFDQFEKQIFDDDSLQTSQQTEAKPPVTKNTTPESFEEAARKTTANDIEEAYSVSPPPAPELTDVDIDIDSRQNALDAAEEIFGSKNGKVAVGNTTIRLLELSVEERFQAVAVNAYMVLTGKANGCWIIGTPGMGKSHTVKEQIEKIGKRKNKPLELGQDYAWVSGVISPVVLYRLLIQNRKKGQILILDDCEFSGGKTVIYQMLKAATDSYAVRRVNYAKDNMASVRTDEEAEAQCVAWEQAVADGDTKVKPPNFFCFAGSMVVITNDDEHEIDPAVLDRCNVVPLAMTEGEKITRMRELVKMNVIAPDMERAADGTSQMGVLDALVEAYQREKALQSSKKLSLSGQKGNPISIRSLVKLLKFAEQTRDWRNQLPIIIQ